MFLPSAGWVWIWIWVYYIFDIGLLQVGINVCQLLGFSHWQLALWGKIGGYVFQQIFGNEFLSFDHFQKSLDLVRVSGGIHIESEIVIFDLVSDNWEVKVLYRAYNRLTTFIICGSEFKNPLQPIDSGPKLLHDGLLWFICGLPRVIFVILLREIMLAIIRSFLIQLVIFKFILVTFLISVKVLVWN